MKKTKRFWGGLACLALLGGAGVGITSFAVANAPSSIGMVKAAEGDEHDFTQSISQLLNNNAKVPSINIGEQGYPIKQIQVSWSHNKTNVGLVTMNVSVGGESCGTYQIGNKSNQVTSIDVDNKTGAVAIDFVNNGNDGTKKGTLTISNVKLVEGKSTEIDDDESSNPVVNAGYTGTPAIQFDGAAFDATGLEFYTEHKDGSKKTRQPSLFTFSPSKLSLGDTEVTATWAKDPSFSFKIPVTVNENSNYSLCFNKIDTTGWTSSYSKHTVVTGKYTVSFSAANKSSQNITDCPVTKGANGDAVFSLNDSSKAFNSFSLTIKQWLAKVNTFQYALGDGISFGTAVTVPALTYDSDKLATFEVTIPADKNVKQIKVNATTGQNQFGWYGFSATAKDAPTPTAEEWASHFLEQTSSPCADGKNNSVASEALNTAWAASKDEFERLADEHKAEVKNAVGNAAGTQLEQAVARYDFIVKKYGAENFADRAVSAPGANIINGTTDGLSASLAVAAIGLTGAVAIGSYFFLRKKKQF